MRPLGDQILTSEFYMKEHTKPTFNSEKRYSISSISLQIYERVSENLKYECSKPLTIASVYHQRIIEI